MGRPPWRYAVVTMRTVLAIILLLGAAVAAAQAYRWTDENGVVHYSDRPRDGAEQIELDVGEATTFRSVAGTADATADPEAPATPAAAGSAPEAAPTTTEYQRLEIVRPQQGEMLWNIGAVASVALRISPNLAADHRIYLVYDGVRRTDLPTESLDIRVPEVYRGEHTLRAQIEDLDGNIILQSGVIRFYVQQSVIRR